MNKPRKKRLTRSISPHFFHRPGKRMKDLAFQFHLDELHAQAKQEWVARRFRAAGWRVFAPHEERAGPDIARDVARVEMRSYDRDGVLLDCTVYGFEIGGLP